MAKKEKFDLDSDELKFDDFDDLEDLSLDPPKDDRSPTRRVVDSAIKSAGKTIASESFLKSFVRASLPKGYSDAIELGSDISSKGRSLYNEATTSLKPAVREFNKASKALLPKVERFIPKALADKIRSLDTDEWVGRSKTQRENDDINSDLSKIFAAQIEQQEQLANQSAADDAIRDLKADRRNNSQLFYLKQLASLQNRLVGYQDNVLSKYQRKSLEIQYRQLFVTRDLFENTRLSNKGILENLAAITKNTALPEFVKQKTTEEGKKWLRDKMVGKVGESFQEYTKNFRENLFKKAQDQVKKHTDGFKRGLFGAAGLMNAASGEGEEGMGYDIAGDFIGSEITNYLGTKAGKLLAPHLAKNPELAKVGAKLQYGVANIPGLIDQFAKSSTDYSRRAKFGVDTPGMINFLKGLLPQYNGNSTSVQNDSIATAKDAAPYSEQDHRSLTEIIPGFLSRILQSTEGIRTGEVPDRVVYNHDRNEFSSYQQAKDDVSRKFVGPKAMRGVEYSLDAMAKKIAPDGKLSEGAQKALKERFLKHMVSGGLYDPKEFAQESFWDPNLDPEVVSELRKAFKNRYSIGDDGKIGNSLEALSRLNSDDEAFKTAASSLPDISKHLNAYANTGHREYLRDLGLLYKNQTPEDQVDHDFLWRFYKNQNNGAINGSERGPQGGGQGMPPGGLPRGTGPVGGSQAAGDGSPADGPLGANSLSVTAAIDPEQIDRVVEGLDSNTIKIIKAIQDCSVRTTLEETNALVSSIGQLLQAGVIGTGGGSAPSSSPQPTGPGFKHTFGSFVGKAFDSGIGLSSKALKTAGRLSAPFGRAMPKMLKWGLMAGGLAALGGNLPIALALGGAYSMFKNKARAIVDVYIPGFKEPVLTANKMLTGEYKDAVTGKVIKCVADIKGAVVDSAGNYVITAKDYAAGLYDSTGKKLTRKLGDFVSGAYGLLGKGMRKGFGLAMSPITIPKKLLEFAAKRVMMPFDVYVKGETVPRLLSRLLNNGQYVSSSTGKPISRYGQIDSAVLDLNGNEVLSVQDISKGLVDRWGKPLKGLLGKVLSMAIGAAKLPFKAAWAAAKFGGKAALATGKLGLKVGKAVLNAPLNVLDRVRGINRDKDVKLEKRSVDILTKIYKLLDARMPGKKKTSVFDSDGDGDRDGSWQDLLSRGKKKKAAAAGKGIVETSKSEEKSGLGKLLVAVLGGLGSLLGNIKEWLNPKNWLEKLAGLLGSIKGEEEEGSIFDGLEDGDKDEEEDDKKKRKKRKKKDSRDGRQRRTTRTRRPPRAPRAPRGGSKWGRAAKWGKDAWQAARSGLGRNAVTNVGRTVASNVGRTAATSVGRTIALNVGRTVVMAGAESLLGAGVTEAAVAGGGALLSGVGASGLGAAAVAAAPAVLIAAIVAGVGYGAYKGYKAFKNRGGDLTDLRWLEYGLDPEDDDSTDKCAELEEYLEDHVRYGGVNGADFDDSIDFKELVSASGLDINDKPMADKWTQWFAYRFKPVYLRYATLVRSYDPSLNVTRVDRLKDEHKGVFAKNSLIFNPACPYDVLGNPFGADPLKGRKEVQAKVDELVAKYPAGKASQTMSTVDSKGLYHSAVAKADKPQGVKITSANHTSVNYLSTNEFEKAKNLKTKLSSGKLLWEEAKGRVIDELTAIRMRLYGLSELNALDVNALIALEKLLAPNLKYSWFDNASLEMDPVGIYVNVATNFNCDPVNEQHRAQWVYWFVNRFSPVFLNYASAVRKADKYAQLQNAWKTLKPDALYAIAKAINGSQAELNDNSVSVWLVAASPFPDQTPNTDSKSVQASLKSLEDKQTSSVMNELNVDAKTGIAKPKDNTTLFGNYNRQAGGSTYSGYGANQQNSKAYGPLPGPDAGGPSTLSGGRAVEHQGGGTGGDINSLPTPAGDGWANVKDLIVAAAKMAGVDPALMATMCGIESGFRVSVKAGTSSAKGLFQFISSTWKDMLKRYGNKYGINPGTPPTDPRANALMAAEYIKENASYLESNLGRQPNDNDLYLAHFLGAGGAVKLLSAPPGAIASKVMPDAAASNEGIFYSNGRPLTVAEVYQLIDQKVGKWGDTVGKAAREISTGGAASTAVNVGMPEYAKGGADDKPLPPAAGGKSTFGESNYAAGDSTAGMKVTNVMPLVSPTTGPVTSAAPVASAAPAAKAAATKAATQDSAVEYVQQQSIAKSVTASTQSQKQTQRQVQQFVDATDLASKTLEVNRSMDATLKQILESVENLRKAGGPTGETVKDSPAKGPSSSKIEHRRESKMPISMNSN